MFDRLSTGGRRVVPILYNNSKCPQSCKGCVPPERHLGCHSTCEKYKQALKEWNDYKDTIYHNSKNDMIYHKVKGETIRATIKKVQNKRGK